MRTFTAVIEKCPQTGLLVGFVPGFPGAHSQGETLDELQKNLREVIAMLLEDGEPQLEAEFVRNTHSYSLTAWVRSLFSSLAKSCGFLSVVVSCSSGREVHMTIEEFLLQK